MKRHERFAAIAIALTFFIVIFDAGALTVAVPALQKSFDADVSTLQWISNAYTLTFASFLLLAGRLTDTLGVRRVLIGGVLLFSAASLCIALSSSAVPVIAFRAIQGLGAAAVANASFAMAGHVFTDTRARASVLAQMNMFGSIGLSSGPVLGGFLVDHTGWQWIFYPNVVVGAVAVVGITRLASIAPAKRQGLDVAGQVLSVVTLFGLAVALIESRTLGWTSSAVLFAGGLFVVGAIAFLAVERRAMSPMLPLHVFRSPSFRAASLAGASWTFSLYGSLFFLSVYFQQTLGFSSDLTGLAFLPITGLPLAANLLSAPMVRRFGTHRVATIGGVTSAAGALVLTLSAGSPYPFTAAGLTLMGFGGGIAMPAVGGMVLEGAPKSAIGAASGVFNTARQVGVLIGVATLGGFAAHPTDTAAHVVPLLAFGVLLLSAITTARLPEQLARS